MTTSPSSINSLLFYCSRSDIQSCFSLLKSGIHGLSSSQVLKIQKKLGKNVLYTQKKKHILFELLRNFSNPLILILLVVSVINLFLGEVVNASIIIAMVILSVVLNFFQEHKANKAAEELKAKVALVSCVLRDGKEIEVRASEIVPGDILILNAGDLIAADARVVEAKDFFVNQSVLTGESFPVEKDSKKVEDDKINTLDLTNIVFAGTSVVTGWAKALVFATGGNTQFGSIAEQLQEREFENSFTLGIKNFSYFILRVVLIFVVFIFLVNAFIRHDFLESLTFAIAIAVGLTPEFLPMIMSVTMAKGAIAMSKKGVIVKKLNAIPTFGSMNILCTDKTGTLTQDKIKLVKYLNSSGQSDEEVLKLAYLNSFFQTGISNPLDEAVKDFRNLNISGYVKVDEIPFDFERKRISVVVKKKGETLMITKGAPEEIFEIANQYWDGRKLLTLDEVTKEKLLNMYEKLSCEGYRILSVATKRIFKEKERFSKKDETELDFVGFAAFLDPIKENVREAIDRLEEMGIEIKVITGDNEFVAKKACIDAGINIKGIMLGREIDHLTDQELSLKAMKTTIFARFSPAQKNRVIAALRSEKNVVGYMGDGVNDAPSLESADVGISVNNAVDIAKETADFILTRKSLMVLADGVKEGRKIFGNTMKYIMMGLSSNFGNMFSVLGAILFLPFLPMLPIQILLNNFLYDISQLTIPSDNVDEEYLLKPQRWNISFIRKFMLFFGPISSIFDFATFGLMYYFFSHSASSFQTGWFMESLATQTLVIHIIRTRKIPFLQSVPSIALLVSTTLVVLIGFIIPFSPLGYFFKFVHLPWYILVMICLLVVGYLLMVEIFKNIFYKKLLVSQQV